MFNSDFRVATTATPSFQQGVNISGFGWTSADQGNYNQLIQYVNECRSIKEEVEAKSAIFDKVATEEENIKSAINFVYESSKEVRDISDHIDSTYQQNLGTLSEIVEIEKRVKTMYNDFLVKYNDFLTKYEEIMNKFPNPL